MILNYNVQDDITSRTLNREKLYRELKALLVPELNTVGVVQADGTEDFRVELEGTITAGHLTIVENTVRDHVGDNGLDLKIYRYVESTQTIVRHLPPKGINYVSGLTTRLHPKRTFVNGELQLVEWYASYDELSNTFSDMVLDVTIAYVYDVNDLPANRTTTRRWYREDGTPHPDTKVTHKFYDRPADRLHVNARKRENIMDEVKINTLGMMLATMIPMGQAADTEEVENIGGNLFSKYQGKFRSYIEVDHRTVVDDLTNETAVWLSNPINPQGYTIRDYMIDSIDYDGTYRALFSGDP